MSRSLKLEKRYVDRSRVILMSVEGLTLDAIEQRVGLSRRAINKWRTRFREHGVEGLKDAPRKGSPGTISAEQKAMVIQKA